MPRSFWRPVRPLRVLAGFLAVAAACTACGGSSGPAKVSLKAAIANPCPLVSSAEARAILGSGSRKPSKGAKGQCLYESASASLGARVISVDIGPGPVSRTDVEGLVTSPAPTAAGHGTLCGANETNSGDHSLFGPFGPSHGLLIIGPSCAINAKFARQVYLHLGS